MSTSVPIARGDAAALSPTIDAPTAETAITPGLVATGPALTPDQIAIIETRDGHQMIEAGAGSGKTTLLIRKLLHETGHPIPGLATAPGTLSIDQVAAITFTTKAAGEITERLRAEYLRRAEAATGQERERWAEQAFALDQALIGTIDAFAGRLLRDYGGLMGVEAGFDVLEASEGEALRQETAERAILEGVEQDHPGALFLVRQFGFLRARGVLADWFQQAPLLVELLAKARTGRLAWADVQRRAGGAREGLALTAVDRILEPHAQAVLAFAGQAHEALVARFTERGVLDFNHVLLKAAELAAAATVQRAFRDRIKLLFVDEHQDTNLTQVRLLFRLAGILDAANRPIRAVPTTDGTPAVPETRLVLIGDPKQSIYQFRGADITMWERSRKALTHAGGRTFRLADNHRARPVLTRFFDDCLGRLLGTPPDDADDARAWRAARTEFEVQYAALAPQRPETPGGAVEVLLAEQKGPAHVAPVVAARIAAMLAHPERYPVFERQPDGTELARPLRRKDIAILSRNLKVAADHYARALQERGIDCYIYGGRGLYGRPEIQDLATLLRAVADPHNPYALIAFLRSPLGQVDDVAIAQLSAAALEAPAPRGTLYEAMGRAATIIPDADRVGTVERAYALLEQLRALRDRVPHHELLSVAIEATAYTAFLAGAPDAPAGLRNVQKFLQIARHASHEPLFRFVETLAQRVAREEAEDEAPIHSPDDDLVVIATFHKAKGLEWPVVFVVGLDDDLFHKVNSEQPRLAEDLGVALPLDLVIRDDTQDHGTPDEAATWAHYVETQRLKEYSEAKRLFYVACTRARDRLFLAGSLKTVDGTAWGKPRSLDPQAEWMHKEGAEHWLRYLYPSLTQGGPRGTAFAFGPMSEAGVIRRGLAAMGAADGEPTTALPSERLWPELPAGIVPAVDKAPVPYSAALQQRLRAFTTEAHRKTEFSASELITFDACPWKHYYGYQLGLSSPTIMTRLDDALVNQVLPAKRGDILHDYLALHDAQWSEDEQRAEMRRAFLRHLPDADLGGLDENVSRMLQHAEHYLKSGWYARIAAAEARGFRVYREWPFYFQLTSTLRFTGSLDVLWEEEDGWRLLDFKTGLFRGEDDPEAALPERARNYELQRGLYSLVADTLLGAGSLREFVFLFTAEPGLWDAKTVTAPWLQQMEYRIRTVVQDIRDENYGPKVYDPATCNGCPLIDVCRPAGAPRVRDTAA